MPKPNDASPQSLRDQLRDGLLIDKNDLDNALVEQPDIFYRVAKEVALAISRRDELKLDMGNAIAELDCTIRADAAKAQEKITEKAIEQEIATAPKIMTMKQDYGRLCSEVDQWSALKEAFQQRSYVLKDLVQLYVSNYYSAEAGRSSRNEAFERSANAIRQTAGSERRLRPINKG